MGVFPISFQRVCSRVSSQEKKKGWHLVLFSWSLFWRNKETRKGSLRGSFLYLSKEAALMCLSLRVQGLTQRPFLLDLVLKEQGNRSRVFPNSRSVNPDSFSFERTKINERGFTLLSQGSSPTYLTKRLSSEHNSKYVGKDPCDKRVNTNNNKKKGQGKSNSWEVSWICGEDPCNKRVEPFLIFPCSFKTRSRRKGTGVNPSILGKTLEGRLFGTRPKLKG